MTIGTYSRVRVEGRSVVERGTISDDIRLDWQKRGKPRMLQPRQAVLPHLLGQDRLAHTGV